MVAILNAFGTATLLSLQRDFLLRLIVLVFTVFPLCFNCLMSLFMLLSFTVTTSVLARLVRVAYATFIFVVLACIGNRSSHFGSHFYSCYCILNFILRRRLSVVGYGSHLEAEFSILLCRLCLYASMLLLM